MSVYVHVISDYDDNEANTKDRERFIHAAWARLHELPRGNDRKKMERIIVKLIEGRAILRSGVCPSYRWNQAVDAAKVMGVGE
jgi:hypothetical protein